MHTPEHTPKRLAAFLFALFLGASGSFAQTTWTGGGDGTTWSQTNNWSAGLPSPSALARFVNGSLSNAPIAINVDSPQTLGALSFSNTGSRTITFSGSAMTIDGTASVTSIASGAPAVTFNSDVVLAGSTSTTWTLGSGSTGHSITFNGNITRSAGTNTRQMIISGNSNQVITINGINAATSLNFGGTGELIAGSTSALGAGSVQKTSVSTLSLRSDVTINGAWTQTTGSPYTYLRISEASPGGTANRTLTFNDRLNMTNGAFEWIPNINSTGKLILELKYIGGLEQTGRLITTESAIVRFAQATNALRTFSALISGAGALSSVWGSGPGWACPARVPASFPPSTSGRAAPSPICLSGRGFR